MFTQSTIETRFDREDGKNRSMGQAKIGLLSCAARRISLLAGGVLRRKRKSQQSCLTLYFVCCVIAPFIWERLLCSTCPECLVKGEEFPYPIFIVMCRLNHIFSLAKRWSQRTRLSSYCPRLPDLLSRDCLGSIACSIQRCRPAFRCRFCCPPAPPRPGECPHFRSQSGPHSVKQQRHKIFSPF